MLGSAPSLPPHDRDLRSPGDFMDPVQPWQPPVIQSVSEDIEIPEPPPLPTAEELAAILHAAQTEGYDTGYAKGYDEGKSIALAKGEEEQRELGTQLLSLMEMVGRPLDKLDERVVLELVDLAIAIAKQIIRRELRTSPGEVVAVVREALGHLPMAARERKMHLHPEDIPLVRNALSLAESEHGWLLQADPLVTRGGCLIETESSYIDASVESRIAAVVRDLLGGEREEDNAA